MAATPRCWGWTQSKKAAIAQQPRGTTGSLLGTAPTHGTRCLVHNVTDPSWRDSGCLIQSGTTTMAARQREGREEKEQLFSHHCAWGTRLQTERDHVLLLLTHLKSKYTVSTRVQTAFTTSVRAPCKHTARVSLYCSGVCAVYSHTNTNHRGHFYVCTHLHRRKEFAAEIQPGRRTKERKKERKKKARRGKKAPIVEKWKASRRGSWGWRGAQRAHVGLCTLWHFGPMSAGWDSPVWCSAATDFGNLRPLPSRKEVEQPKPPLNHPECKIKGKIK